VGEREGEGGRRREEEGGGGRRKEEEGRAERIQGGFAA